MQEVNILKSKKKTNKTNLLNTHKKTLLKF